MTVRRISSRHRITEGIAADDFVRVVREDRVRPGLLYAGTEHTVYYSTDDGAHWKSLGYNLPDTQIADLVVEKHDLVIATHGRSFYVLDDIDWLRQTTAAMATETVHLFEPHEAMRNVDDAAIDYRMAKPAEKVTIEILDAANKLVGSFTSVPAGKKPAEDEREERGAATRPPTNTVGMNRFQWNLRYPGPYAFPGMVLWGAAVNRGPMALPGTYHVRLTADGVTQSQDLVVVADSRVRGTTPQDLQKQFDLALTIRDQVSAADTIVSKIRQIRGQVEELAKANPEVTAQAAGLLASQMTIEEAVYQTQNRSDQDPLNFPIRLNNFIGALGRSVMSGDEAPTAQAYEVEADLTARLAVQQKAFDGSLGRQLAELNEFLKTRKLKVVTVTVLPEKS
jgi:hypothetical protein